MPNLKVCLGLRQFLIFETPLKMIKNVFYFSCRSREIYIFVLTLWLYRKNDLIRKLGLILTFMTSQTGYQTFTIAIFPNISRSKGSQDIKFVQLIKYHVRNIFLQKSSRKCGWETSSKPPCFGILKTFR